MSITNKDHFILADNIQMQHAAGKLSLVVGGKKVYANEYTLVLLNEFIFPNTIEKALSSTKHLAHSIKDSVSISSHLITLIEAKVLTASNSKRIVIPQMPDGDFSGAEVHIRMLNDSARTLFYQDIIKQTVKPSDVVLEIGTGTGVLAATIAMTGCRHVYTIERNENFARKATQLFIDNGLNDKITVIIADSKNVELPEKADVLVSEIIGNDPFAEDILDTINDAKNRLLTANARIIPETLNVYAVCCELPQELLSSFSFTNNLIQQWNNLYGIDFSTYADQDNALEYRKLLSPKKFSDYKYLTHPVLIAQTNMTEINNQSINGEHIVTCTDPGLLNGILLYFEIIHGNKVLSLEPKSVTKTNSWSNYVWIQKTSLNVTTGNMIKLGYHYNDIVRRSEFELDLVT